MKKKSLTELALMGLASGVFVSAIPFSIIAEATESNLIAANTPSKANQPQSGVNVQKKPSPAKGRPIATADSASDTVDSSDSSENADSNPNDENITYHLMTEDELMGLLNKKSRELYMSLDAEGKALALEVASTSCNNTNKCEGLNACQTPDNDCAGKGKCKGQSKCSFADKNLAIKLVAEKMAKKRQKAASHK